MRYDSSDSARLETITLALAELGSTDAEPYWQEVLTSGPPYPKHWCGAFALRNLRLAELCDWHWIIGKGFLYRLGPPRVWRHGKPFDGSVFDVGDIAYFERHQHHAVVWGWHEERVRLIQGNGEGAAVTTSLCHVTQVTAFYSIGRLVDRYDKKDDGDSEEPPPTDPSP